MSAVLIPPNLHGKTLKVVTKDYDNGSNCNCSTKLSGKTYTDDTTIGELFSDIVETLGGDFDVVITKSN